jgi:hypothetical protein
MALTRAFASVSSIRVPVAGNYQLRDATDTQVQSLVRAAD